MGALAWWLIPVLATIAATIWAAWAGRADRDPGDAASLAGYERFREAMSRGSGDTHSDSV